MAYASQVTMQVKAVLCDQISNYTQRNRNIYTYTWKDNF